MSTATRRRRQLAASKLPKGLTRLRACELLGTSRATIYRDIARPTSDEDSSWDEKSEHLAARINQLHVDHPAWGARKIARVLATDGELYATRWRVTRLMDLMGICPCCPLPSASKPSMASKKFPYLLKNKKILFPNQVWSTDITYVQIGGHHMYLSAVIDWYSRYIVSWRLSDTMRACEAVSCVKDAFEKCGTPSIMNSDQGSVYGALMST